MADPEKSLAEHRAELSKLWLDQAKTMRQFSIALFVFAVLLVLKSCLDLVARLPPCPFC